MPLIATLTERSFYPELIGIIRSKGGSGISEVEYQSVPDIQFDLDGLTWILSVKIGQTNKIMKDALIQYLQHKQDSGITRGVIVFLAESARKVRANEQPLRDYLAREHVLVFVDAGLVKEEIRDRTFGGILDYLRDSVAAELHQNKSVYFPLSRVVDLLQAQVSDLMSQIDALQESTINAISSEDLLESLGAMRPKDAGVVLKFLASYIFLSQIMFMRLLASSGVGIVPEIHKATRSTLRQAFNKILQVDYRAIYQFDVLDAISDEFISQTFILIWGLEIERVKYELPGRIFHALMPPDIRKMMAAFYTRPHAAELLAKLSIDDTNCTVMDLACGSGTILTAAYRRKRDLWETGLNPGNPHQRYCESQIFGADIMPFAVHLATANLASMDPGTIIERTQIICGDSLRLVPKKQYRAGPPSELFSSATLASKSDGDVYDVELMPVDAILMNPPFTKTERGIARYVDMQHFAGQVGQEVGLWGHFIALADTFLKPNGIFAAVIPINVLRGRESKGVRDILFRKWTPLFVLKPTINYAFSESSEYRDVIVVAKKSPPRPDHKVKFGLVKANLSGLTDTIVNAIAETVKASDSLRTDEHVDVESFTMTELAEHRNNMMWFCGTTTMEHRDVLSQFANKARKKLATIPERLIRSGFRPSGGVSSFLFLTNSIEPSRAEQAFLRMASHTDDKPLVECLTPTGAPIQVERKALLRSLRTPVGLRSMNVANQMDLVATTPYSALKAVCSAAGVPVPNARFWLQTSSSLSDVETHLAISRRINPFSPNTSLIAFYSNAPFSPSDQLNVIHAPDRETCKALCVVLNSALFLAQFFMGKEESTGRYVDIRSYDLLEMALMPDKTAIADLNHVYDAFCDAPFPPLSQQMDTQFVEHYAEQGLPALESLFSTNTPMEPNGRRLEFDLAVCAAIGARVRGKELKDVYRVIAQEMMAIRRLTRD
ncbi:MAG: HsdM family class I SAM-dependent methyltransferase [Candidatus Cryosericum sp.]